MNDNEKLNAEEIRQTERERMSQVFAAPSTKGKEATAQALLSKTELAAEDILNILATIPDKSDNAFEKAMAAIKNPDIRPAAEIDDETPEAVAQRIASFVKE